TFHTVQSAVREIMAETPRASSMVENLNSRLRNYFFLRRHIGNCDSDSGEELVIGPAAGSAQARV
ncbi:MAG: hypothetical protein U9Q79_05460, partial [Candidatus Hydrogenedentes bacterium]|nr:hypothetical protein [Candidatus Hydrogenedentota bacterium]